jgi:hypothetical protein
MTEALQTYRASYFPDYLVNFSRLFDACYLACMIFLADALRDFSIDFPALTLRFWFPLRPLPKRVENWVNVFRAAIISRVGMLPSGRVRSGVFQ